MLTADAYYSALSQLSSLRSSYYEVSWKISLLNSCSANLSQLYSYIQHNHALFSSESQVHPGNWKGERATWYVSPHTSHIAQAHATYLKSLDRTLDQIDAAKASLTSELSSIESAMQSLEYVISAGYTP